MSRLLCDELGAVIAPGMRAKAVAKIAVNDTMVYVELCCRSAWFDIAHESDRIPLYTVGNGVKAKAT